MPTPSYDPLGSMDSGVASGVAIASSALRMQQLQSEMAYRRMEEQQMAQTMALQLYQHNQTVQEQADNLKKAAAFQTMIQPTITIQTPGIPNTPGTAPLVDEQGQPIMGTEGRPISNQSYDLPNPHYVPDMGTAYIQSFLPGAKNPAQVIATGGALTLHQAQAAHALQQAKEAQFQSQPGSMQLPSGRNVEGIYTSRGHFQPIYSPEITNLTNPVTGEETPVIVSGNSVKNVPTDIGERQTRQKMLAKALDIDPSQVDENGNLLPGGWAAIQKQGQITTGTRAGLEKQMSEFGKVTSLGNQLADLLTPQTTGPIGNAVRAYEGLMSAINPDFKIGPATEAATVATEFQAALVRSMKSDSNIAEPERKQLQKAMPSVTEWGSGVNPAKVKLASVLQQAGALSRNNALIRGKPITKEWLTPQELVEEFAAGKITRADADALKASNGWLLINKLRGEAQK